MIQAAGSWDDGEIVAVRMSSGRAQEEESRRLAALGARELENGEKHEIQRRRADSIERRRSSSLEAERRKKGGDELAAKLAKRRAAEAAAEEVEIVMTEGQAELAAAEEVEIVMTEGQAEMTENRAPQQSRTELPRDLPAEPADQVTSKSFAAEVESPKEQIAERQAVAAVATPTRASDALRSPSRKDVLDVPDVQPDSDSVSVKATAAGNDRQHSKCCCSVQ